MLKAQKQKGSGFWPEGKPSCSREDQVLLTEGNDMNSSLDCSDNLLPISFMLYYTIL